MDYFLAEGARETEMSSRRMCMPYCLLEVPPESPKCNHDPRVLQAARIRTGPSTLMKQWNKVLQVRAQSSQTKVLQSTGLAAIRRDSFAHELEYAVA